MLSNSHSTYGAVTKTFHWVMALLVLTMIPLGIYANGLPFDTDGQLARKAWLFSLHKTIGVAIFFTGLGRIAWAVSQPKPGLLNADKKLESFLAELVHWLLYASLVLVPLSGWMHHAATTGFAPIWWPFGQSLPFMPKDDDLAHFFAALHIIFERVLAVSFLLHFVGALKHHLIDKDITLKRMLPGTTEPGALPPHQKTWTPIISAVAIYTAALTIGTGLGLFSQEHTDAPAVPPLAAVETGWQVQEGTLQITVKQLGSDVTGRFADWTAAIHFDPEADVGGKYGSVEVQIAVPSLKLGSVTSQALGADFFDAAAHPTALYVAEIIKLDGGYLADGTLTLKGVEIDADLSFALSIEGDLATMSGQTVLNRTAFGIGESYKDESSVGFDVMVDVALTAQKLAPD